MFEVQSSKFEVPPGPPAPRALRRLSTLAFARRAVAHLDNGAKLAEALELPQIADILDTMDAHDAAYFFLLFPFQTFKSLVGQLRLLRNHYVRARPALWYSPTDDFAKEFAVAKLNSLFDALPEMRALRYDDPAKSTTLRKMLIGGASHLLLSAKTENDRHGKTACDLYRDEVHLYETGWMAQISNRRGAYPEEFTETDMSTGLTKGDVAGGEATQRWELTDQRTWHVRCPACQKFFEPLYLHRDDATQEIIGGLIYEKAFLPNGLPDERAIAATLRYRCPRCRSEKLTDRPGTRAALSGTRENPRGLYVSMNANPSARAFGWTCHGIALRPWLPMVVRFETAQLARARGDLEPLAKCIREEFAGIWEPEKYFRTDKFNRYQHPTPYEMKEPWAGELRDAQGRPFRFGLIDWQQDHEYLVIRSWGSHSQSRLYFTKKTLSPSELRDILLECEVPPERTFVDTRYDTVRVRRIAARMGWMTVMGDKEVRDYLHEDGVRRIFDKPKAMDSMTGTLTQGDAHSFVIETLFSKNAALNRLALLRDPEIVAPDGSPIWTAASDAPDWYYRQINAHYRKRVDHPDGTHHYVWHGQKDDHAGDCEAMAVVAASMANLTGAESLESPDTEKSENKKS